MEDENLTIVFGSLGATLALVSALFAYLQFRGSRLAATRPNDEEEAVPTTAAVVQTEPVINSPYVTFDAPAVQSN